MAYRVYDKKREKWLDRDVYLSPNGELFQITKSILGGNKLTFISQDRYVYQKSIELNDKNGNEIYIGDYLKAQVADDKTITGIVTFATELSAYIVLCFDNNEYYTLGTDVCQLIEIIGNVFDDNKRGKKNGKQALRKQKK